MSHHDDMKSIPIYPHTGAYAHANGEIDKFRESNLANIACKAAIQMHCLLRPKPRLFACYALRGIYASNIIIGRYIQHLRIYLSSDHIVFLFVCFIEVQVLRTVGVVQFSHR